MLKRYKAESRLSYLIAIIFIIIIFATVITNFTSIIERNRERKYVSTSSEDLLSKKEKNISKEQVKDNMIKFYEANKGKYVKWTLKAYEVNEFFDTIKCPVNMETSNGINLFIKCKFEKSIKGKVKKGDIITVSGQITGYSEFAKSIELKYCRIENRD